MPDVTGDFDNRVALAPDGPYIGRGDDGEVRGYRSRTRESGPYFSHIEADPRAGAVAPMGPATFAPNRMVVSAGGFGSLPTGVASNVPWQTLLFRPDPWLLSSSNSKPENRHYGSKFPRDHLFMDLFWMPVVEPFAISEPFETRGKINMNYQILPFTYIKRATALHALFKSEKIMAIPNRRSMDYKTTQRPYPARLYPESCITFDNFFRHHIDADETLKQWERRFADRDPMMAELRIKPGAFISATEICDMWLVPEGQRLQDLDTFWPNHALTGDNVKERPYARLYSRLTTRSNAYRVHVVAQTLRKVKGSELSKFDPARDKVTAEFKGSFLVERSIDPIDPQIPDYASEVVNFRRDYKPLDRFYTYRISQVKQVAR